MTIMIGKPAAGMVLATSSAISRISANGYFCANVCMLFLLLSFSILLNLFEIVDKVDEF